MEEGIAVDRWWDDCTGLCTKGSHNSQTCQKWYFCGERDILAEVPERAEKDQLRML